MTSPDPLDSDPSELAALLREPVSTDEDLLARVRELVQRAFRRQLWLVLIDETDRQLGVLPRFDIPRRPDELAVRELLDRLCLVAAEAGAAHLAVVYERPGPERLAPADREWLRLLSCGEPQHGVVLRGPLFAHVRGVRWVGAEDLDDPSVAVGE